MATDGRMDFSGIDIAPLRKPHLDVKTQLELLDQIVANEKIDTAHRPKPEAGLMPVFVDEAGDEYTVFPTTAGPTLLPWVSGSPMDIKHGRLAAGGFVEAGAVQGLRKDEQSHPSIRDSDKTLIAAVLDALTRMGLIRLPQHSDVPGGQQHQPLFPRSEKTGAPDNEMPGEPTGDTPGGATAPSMPAQTKPALVDNKFFEPGMQALASAVGRGIAGGGFGAFSLLGELKGVLTSVGLSMVMGSLLKKLMPVDDESSTGEWALSQVGPLLAQQLLKGSGYLDKICGTYKGPYESPALRVGDQDKNKNAITSGCPTVLIEGAAAARVGDIVDKNGKKTKFGAAKVLIGGSNAARVDDPAGYGTKSQDGDASFLLAPAAKKTTIGGGTTNPKPPIPEKMKAESGIPESKVFPFDPDGTPPEAGYVFNPQEGEWRMWDPELGYSASLTEYELLPDWKPYLPDWMEEALGLNTSWKRGDSGSVLWGLFKLGTPYWPGAGTGSTWFVPDRVFGIDMGSMYLLHDWMFNPSDPETGNLPGLLRHLGVEWRAFLEGLRSHDNPIGWILQVIYSAATTSAALSDWWDNYFHRKP